MLHTKFRGNQSTGSGEEDFEWFYHIWTWWPSLSCDQHHVNKFSFLVPESLHIKFCLKWPIGSEERQY